ncbi:MAG: hypothetical protein RL095_1066 [Verrucomicrobiota bacterium]|jgi:hypothetical protein
MSAMWIAPSSRELSSLVALMRPEARPRVSPEPSDTADRVLSLSTRSEALRRYRADLIAWAGIAGQLDDELRGRKDDLKAPLARSTAGIALGGSSDDNATVSLSQLADSPLSASGSLRLNGIDILVSAGVDTVDSLLSRINRSASGVNAALNRKGELVLSSESSFQISGDPALLEGLGFKESWVSPSPDSSLLERLQSPPAQLRLRALDDAMDRLSDHWRHRHLDPVEHSESLARIGLRLRDGIRDNLSPGFNPLQEESFSSGFGLDFGFRGEGLWTWKGEEFRRLDSGPQERFAQLLGQGLGPQGWSLLRGVRAAILGEAERYGGAEILG